MKDKQKYDKYGLKDFDKLNFHDAILYGIKWQVIDPAYFSISLDILYIRKWINDKGRFKGKKSKGTLTFKYISNLKINIDWKNYISEPMIVEIKKTKKKFMLRKTKDFFWKIVLAGPDGKIIFQAPDFELLLEKKTFVENI